MTEDALVKFVVGSQVWLVPELEATELFRSAVEKLNGTCAGAAVSWSKEELDEFNRLRWAATTWRPI